jgi:hypothetical protein
MRMVARRMTVAAGDALPDEQAAVHVALDALQAARLDKAQHQVLASLLARELARWMAAHEQVTQAYDALRLLVEPDEGAPR